MDEKKVTEFLDLLRIRTIARIETSNIKESCTATLMLIFAAIDSLSKITCDKDEYDFFIESDMKQGNKRRFTGFLKERMGGKYTKVADKLYELRNDVMHTGIGTQVTLSRQENGADHLQEVEGVFWVNTLALLSDLEEELDRIYQDIEAKGTFFNNASVRLGDMNIVVDHADAAVPSEGLGEPRYR